MSPEDRRAQPDELLVDHREDSTDPDIAPLGTAGDGRYVQQGEIDRGGMGTVKRVFDRQLHRRVAMKVLSPELARNPAEAERFREEARLTGGLDHPNIPAVHELGLDADGLPYFTMKLVQGATLLDLLRAPTFTPTDAGQLFHVLQILLKACQAVSFAHAREIAHCDLKPQNLMVGSHGQVYVMDWGIARPLRREGAPLAHERRRSTAQVEGTAAYMSPEQAHGRLDEVDARTDVFGLGGVLYRILAGRAPYTAPDVARQLALAKEARIEPPWLAARNPQLPRHLCDVAMKALARDPADRFQCVEELQRAIEGYLRGEAEFAAKVFQPGSLIVREGDEGDAAYLVLEGRCRVYKMLDTGRHVLGELGPGAVFGETAIFASQPRTATVEAITAVKATVITRPLLEQEMARTYWVGHLVKALAERFRSVNDRAARQDEERTLSELSQEILRHMLRQGASRAVPWTPLKLQLCRRFQRTGPETTSLVSRLPAFELDLGADELRVVDA